jgi:hypothetical protein
MPFKKGQSGNPHGRERGTPNKVSGAAKDAIALAAEKLGGVKRLVTWVKEDKLNERAFWTQIYPRLLPHEVTGPGGAALVPESLVFLIAKAPHADCRD